MGTSAYMMTEVMLRERLGELLPEGVALGPGGEPTRDPTAAHGRCSAFSTGLSSGHFVWQFVRDNWLSNRIFKSYDDLVDHCCAAWNKLVDQPWRIMSIGLRQWAHGF
jgi:hypothetical protein